MEVAVTFRHVRATRAIREYAEEKVARLDRYVHRPMEAHVILSVEKKEHRAEISLVANGASLFSDKVTGDLYSAIDLATDKIERQVKKLAAKRKDHKAPKAFASAPSLRLHVLSSDDIDERGAPTVIRTRRIPAKPMSLDEAVMQIGLTNNEFFVFRSAASGELCVIYRRRDGNIGLIESER